MFHCKSSHKFEIMHSVCTCRSTCKILFSTDLHICKLEILSASPNIYMCNDLFIHFVLQTNSSNLDRFYWMIDVNTFRKWQIFSLPLRRVTYRRRKRKLSFALLTAFSQNMPIDMTSKILCLYITIAVSNIAEIFLFHLLLLNR